MLLLLFLHVVPVLALALACWRACWHDTARLSTGSAVPGSRAQHAGTNRHGTDLLPCLAVPCPVVPCLAVLVPVPCRAAQLAIYSHEARGDERGRRGGKPGMSGSARADEQYDVHKRVFFFKRHSYHKTTLKMRFYKETKWTFFSIDHPLSAEA
jgi:hypothetical protein